MASVTPIDDPTTFESSTTALPSTTLQVIYFHAPWAAPCAQMSQVLSALASTYPATSSPAAFYSINAEELPDLSEAFDVTAVPYIVLRRGNEILDTVSGGDAARVRDAVERLAPPAGKPTNGASLPPAQSVNRPAQQPAPAAANSSGTDAGSLAASSAAATGEKGAPAKNLSGYAPSAQDAATAPEFSSGALQQTAEDKAALMTRLKDLTTAAPVMLFMKGTPSAPQCGFSRQLVSILREHGVRYGFFNILADEDVRQGMKEFADWPTFPQLWLRGDLVGGLDIVREEIDADPEFFGDVSVKGKGGPAGAEEQKAAGVTA